MAYPLQHRQTTQFPELQTTGSEDSAATISNPCHARHPHDTMTSDSLSSTGIDLGGSSRQRAAVQRGGRERDTRQWRNGPDKGLAGRPSGSR